MAAKRMKPDDLDRIVAPIVDAIGTLRAEMTGVRVEMTGMRDEMSGLREEMTGLRSEMHDGFEKMDLRLGRVERNTAETATAVRRLERGATGIGRTSALEERVRRIEDHLGFEPPRRER